MTLKSRPKTRYLNELGKYVRLTSRVHRHVAARADGHHVKAVTKGDYSQNERIVWMSVDKTMPFHHRVTSISSNWKLTNFPEHGTVSCFTCNNGHARNY